MRYLFAVGQVTETAVREIKHVGGSVMHVSSVPSVLLVSIPYPQLEYMDNVCEMRIKKGRMSLVWRGHYPGPGLTPVDETTLSSEWNEPQEAQTLLDDGDLGDINDCLF